MILGILALLVSLSISAIAIYFSVSGWMSLFAAEAFGVMLMFGAIEIGKLIAAGFLHWHWFDMQFLHRWLLAVMVVVTMLLTSVGIFGFLSKGHLDQENPAMYADLKMERIDKRIKLRENTINSSSVRLDQLDSIVNKLIQFDKISGKTGAKAVRKSQEEERIFLKKQIDDASVEIDNQQDIKYETQKIITDTRAKLGPIKYIVEMFGMNDRKDDAVRIVIMLAIFVFDPFAIALLLAGLWTFKRKKKN